jgi:hypothetical protein
MSKLVAVYNDDKKLMEAADMLVEAKAPVEEIITPFVIEELLEKFHVKSNIPLLAFFYGVFGLSSVFAALYYTFVVDYPINIGGKPNLSLTFPVLLFVGTVLTTVLTTVGTFFYQDRLYIGKKPEFEYPGINDDKMVVLVDKDGLSTDMENKLREIFEKTGAEKVDVV